MHLVLKTDFMTCVCVCGEHFMTSYAFQAPHANPKKGSYQWKNGDRSTFRPRWGKISLQFLLRTSYVRLDGDGSQDGTHGTSCLIRAQDPAGTTKHHQEQIGDPPVWDLILVVLEPNTIFLVFAHVWHRTHRRWWHAPPRLAPWWCHREPPRRVRVPFSW